MATTHVVQKGENLSAIARKYGTTYKKLVELNKEVYPSLANNPNYIAIGWKLVVDGTPATPPVTTGSIAKNVSVALEVGSDRTLIARWDWSGDNTDHYLVRWWWGPEGQLGVLGEESTSDWKYARWTAPANAERVSFYVKPISKTYKQGDNDVSYWVCDWTTKVTYYFKDNPPTAGNTPSVEIENGLMTITVNDLGDTNAKYVEFEIVKDNGEDWITDPVPIAYDSVKYSCPVDAGSDYKVRCRTIRDDMKSDWSAYSSTVGTAPAASGGITVCRAASSTSVHLAWTPVSNAKTYEIEFATKREYFDSSDETSTRSGITTPNYTLTGLESGSEYFFRVRAVNDNGTSPWTGIRGIIIGKAPDAPTTWSSTTTAVVGEKLVLYWVHNSEDGSKQTKADLSYTVGGVTKTITIPKSTPEDEEEETSYYEFDTSPYVAGTKIVWKVRTYGIMAEPSDWSISRTVDVYAKPTLNLRVTNQNGVQISTLTRFPFKVVGVAGPNTQKPISYHLSIISTESYETVDHIGNEKTVVVGDVIYSKYFDIDTNLTITISANDIDLENNVRYMVNCIVCMDSGLTAESIAHFTVSWDDVMYEPNAEIGIDNETCSAVIRPYCEDETKTLVSDVTLSVYRREFNGSYVEIAKGLPNTKFTFVTDPHPSLDYARYRIVAISNSTGAVSYSDLAGYPVGEIAAVLQWNEKWSDFDVSNGAPSERSWSGSMLKLPYNIDVANSHSIDTALIEYIGRKHPVSYYGTQLGETASWSMEIPKSDKETLYALRRLAAWTGDVYVREPSGSGYWANVSVSFSQTHLKLTIPITLDITRVEGGI